VSKKADEIFKEIRRGARPYFMEALTYRWKEHVGPFFDHEMNRNYRSKEEFDYWIKKCPLESLKKVLLEDPNYSDKRIQLIDKLVSRKVFDAFEFAENSPYPLLSSGAQRVYSE
jgi:pyruvate dehydrogenase E1 component alpha subunit